MRAETRERTRERPHETGMMSSILYGSRVLGDEKDYLFVFLQANCDRFDEREAVLGQRASLGLRTTMI